MEERGLKKKFTEYVNGLSECDVRKELVLAYLQMERCQHVLRGDDVKPVAMKDNGMSSDLELFYLCRKVREELDSPDDSDYEEDDDDYMEVTFSGKSVDEVVGKLKDFFSGRQSGEEGGDGGRQCMYSVGDRIWYMYGDMVQHSQVKSIMHDSDGMVIYGTQLGHKTAESETFGSLDELINSLRRNVHE